MKVVARAGYGRIVYLLPMLVAGIIAGGCSHKPAVQSTEQIPITVAKPVNKPVSEYREYIGWIDAIDEVKIQARVTGYILDIPFEPGKPVKLNQDLFIIDPITYKAEVAKAEAEVKRWTAKLSFADENLTRERKLRDANQSTQAALDLAVANQAEAIAALHISKENVKIANENLGFTTIKAPVPGIVSKNLLSVGDLVNSPSLVLTTIVPQAKMYFYFEADQRTVQEYLQAVADKKIKAGSKETLPVELTLEGTDKPYPHIGKIDFADNQLNQATGGLRMRAEFDNAEGLLAKGFFGKVRIPMGEPAPALLVAETSVMTQQSLRYVYVVRKGKVERILVTVGQALPDRLVPVLSSESGDAGLKPDDLVIVSGMQNVQPGMEVKTETVAMPALADTKSSTDAKEPDAKEPPSGKGE